MLPVKIAGLGSYLPDRCITSSQLEHEYGLPDGWIERAAGVRERRRANGETAAEMAASAARRALDDAHMTNVQIDLLIGASSAPQQVIPCTAAFVQRELGLPDGASACFDVNATCLSFLVALQTAAHLVASGAHHHALIFSSELSGRSLSIDQPESAVLFGDASAAAIVMRADDGDASRLWQTSLRTFSGGAELAACEGAGTRHHPNDPETTSAMNRFRMDGPALFKLASRVLGPFLDEFLAGIGWRREEIDAVVPHQASGPALRQLSRRFGFVDEQIFLNLSTRGNCIAASIPLALAEAVAAGRIRRGARVLLLGTGAGLSLGAAALTY